MKKNKSQLQKAIEVFKKGGIVIYPTDTAFGIGARIDDSKAVQKLFKIRKRPIDKAVPILASDVDMALKYVDDVSETAKKLMEKYWPGGLTIVLKANKKLVSNSIRGGGDTVGIRVPDHKKLRHIIKKLGVPIVGSSANFADNKTPYLKDQIDTRLTNLVDYILTGKNHGSIHSTVIDATSKRLKILREGKVKI